MYFGRIQIKFHWGGQEEGVIMGYEGRGSK